MKIDKVLLIGGSGFIGTSVAERLAAKGVSVTIPTRRRERGKHLFLLPTVDVVESDVFDAATLAELVSQHDAVINLVGILHGDFERAHVTLPTLIANACVKARVSRLIQMSALQADASNASAYLSSRGRGEDAVRAVVKDNPSLNVTFFRPSVVFGERDKFLNLFATLLKYFPVLPLGSPDATFQPVWVEDVARAIVAGLWLRESHGQCYRLAGPKVYTLREMMALVLAITGRRRLVVGLGGGLSMLQASVLGVLPGKLLTPDMVVAMRTPSTSSEPYPSLFGSASSLESIVGTYMATTPSGGPSRYQQFRDAARR